MANEEHLKRLREGIEAWNRWLGDHPEITKPGLDLSNANLHGVYLSKADFRRADLSGANLAKANLCVAKLSGAHLSGANLRGADLRGADLFLANLNGADLSEADLRRADFRRADLSGANLRKAKLEVTRFHETKFGNTNLTDTQGLEKCYHHGASILDHRTLQQSGPLPPFFLRGCGLPDALIDYLPSLLNQPIQYYSCFISYSHDDKAFARRIYDALQGKGIRCWLDEHDILPGDDIYEQVDFGIRLWDKTLLCCSESSLTSWWVDNEIDTAFAKERQIMEERKQKVLALIPLNLDGYLFSDDFNSGKKQQLHSRLAADFRNWKRNHDKFEQQLDKVIKALQLDGGRKSPPEPKL